MNVVEIDKNLFLLINSFSGKFAPADGLIRLVVNEYFVPVSLALLVLYLWVKKDKRTEKERRSLPIALYSIGLSALVIIILNQFLDRGRPFEEMPVNLLFYQPTDPSFPSNAAAVGVTLATSIFLVNKKFGMVAIVLAALFSFSRVYAGVHYPSDVLVGAILGTVSALLVNRFKDLIEKTKRVLEEAQRKIGLELP